MVGSLEEISCFNEPRFGGVLFTTVCDDGVLEAFGTA